MNNFELDSRLANDCHFLGKLNHTLLLLMDNTLVPWFILVPETGKTELFELSPSEKQVLYKTIDDISDFLKTHFEVDKLNVAAIGNIVKQLHVHVIGRATTDFCWPGVVWGAQDKETYSPERIEEIVSILKMHFRDTFQNQDDNQGA